MKHCEALLLTTFGKFERAHEMLSYLRTILIVFNLNAFPLYLMLRVREP